MEMPQDTANLGRAPSSTGFLSKLTFSWVSPLISFGLRHRIDTEHIPDYEDDASFKFSTLLKSYSPMHSMCLLIQNELLLSAGYYLVYATAQVANPLLLRALVNSIVDNTGGGGWFALALFVSGSFSAFSNQHHYHLAFSCGQKLRSSMIHVIYNTALEMKFAEFQGVSKGEIVNLLANDSQKLFEIMPTINLIWAAPIMLIVVTGLLVNFLGLAALPGIFMLVCLGPLNVYLANWQKRVRKLHVPTTDRRLQMCNEVLQGIRVVKYFSWETKFQEAIKTLRTEEVEFIRTELQVWAVSIFLLIVFPSFAVLVTFWTHSALTGEINAADTFAALGLFGALKFPLMYVGQLISNGTQAYVSMRRFTSFLAYASSHKSLDSADIELVEPASSDAYVKFNNADICWSTESNQRFTLENINLSASKGDLVVIVGSVGSGKTLFGLAVLDEVTCISGTMKTHGSIAYVSQEGFIMNASVRDNILFGMDFDSSRYLEVLDACQLRGDLKQWTNLDRTIIGERGITLSGGQKARVSLARAVYSGADIVVLDDPLSAVDAHTGKKIFERVLSDQGLLGGACKIFVTHAVQYLSYATEIIVLEEGKVLFQGDYPAMVKHSTRQDASDVVTTLLKGTQEVVDNMEVDEFIGDEVGSISHKKGEALMTEEERSDSTLDWSIVWQYIYFAGGSSVWIILLLVLIMERFFFVFADWWLAVWSSGGNSISDLFNLPRDSTSSLDYIYVYLAIVLINAVFVYMRLAHVAQFGSKASETLFLTLLEKVLKSPMVFFETTPLGRILNRFSFDLEVMDFVLVTQLNATVASSFWMLSALVVITIVTPWALVGVAPIMGVFWVTQWYFRRTNLQLQRHDSVSRSPIQGHFSETLDGTVTIRAYQMQPMFTSKNEALLDTNNSALYAFTSSQRWLGLRIELIGAIITGIVAGFVSLTRDSISGGLAGLVIIWCFNLTTSFNFFVVFSTQTEARLNSVERVLHYVNTLEPEEDEEMVSVEPTYPEKPTSVSQWVKEGRIEFKDVVMRYRPELEPALKGLSFTVNSRERVGIVGRTGSGKSSIAVTLFRLRECEQGKVLVDGVDLSTLRLSSVRGEGICIIPQDPVLFTGTIRENLDPFYEFSDEDVNEGLRLSRIEDFVNSLEGGINYFVTPGGGNFSVGQRQLLCLARSMIRKPKILVMDEATASVDSATDSFIQETVRTQFKDCTVLEIAHRLHTVMDADRVLVMDAGRVVEFDTPTNLLKIPNGVFLGLVEATGDASANQLRAMVET